MKKIIIISLILIYPGILISGCIDYPIREVPVIKVNITYLENQGVIEAPEYDFYPGTVNFLNRPRGNKAPFPAIAARTMISKGKNSTIGEWEMLPYTGPGIYSFDIGFLENKYPVPDDILHISVYVLNENGDRIGVITKDIVWK